MSKNDLGSFISDKRKEKCLSLRKLALNCGISVTYLSDIENNRSSNISKEILEKICQALTLNSDEADTLFALVGKRNDAVALDIQEFVKKHPEVEAFLREVKRGEHAEWLNGLKKDDKA